MYLKLTLCTFAFLLSMFCWSQTHKLKLTNVVVIGQFDKIEDRFTIESTLTRLFKEASINAVPSLNYVKTGENIRVLHSDSVRELLAGQGYDMYLIASVRGYDRRYKPSQRNATFSEKLEEGTLREIFIKSIVSVTFEFAFYKNNELISITNLRCSNISDRESVMKRFVKKTKKHIHRYWK